MSEFLGSATYSPENDNLREIKTKAEVDASRTAGGFVEDSFKRGFYLKQAKAA